MPAHEGNTYARVQYKIVQSMLERKAALAWNLHCLTLQFSQCKSFQCSGLSLYLDVRNCLTREIAPDFSDPDILNICSHTTWFRLSCLLMNISQLYLSTPHISKKHMLNNVSKEKP